MEHQCHHCNAPVPDGTPFCAACGAPQIRVAIPHPATPPPEQAGLPSLSSDRVEPAGSNPRVRWSTAFPRCALVGAAIAVAISLIRFPLISFLLLPIGGAVAVWAYSRGNWKPAITAGIGARIGAVTGLIGFGFYALVLGAVMYFQRAEVYAEVTRALKDAAAQNSNPQAQQMMSQLMSPGGMAIIITLSVVLIMVFFLVLCTLGGALGAVILKNKSNTST